MHVFFRFLARLGEVVVPPDRSYDPAVHLSVGDVKVDSRTKLTYVLGSGDQSIKD